VVGLRQVSLSMKSADYFLINPILTEKHTTKINYITSPTSLADAR